MPVLKPVTDVSRTKYGKPSIVGFPVGAILRTPDGGLWRVAETRSHTFNRAVRINKPGLYGAWVFKAGEEKYLYEKPEPEVWKRGIL